MPASTLGLDSRFRTLGLYVLLIGLLAAVQFPAHAETRLVQIKPAGLTLNAKLMLSDQGLKGGRIVLMLHGTLAHHDMEIIKGLQGALYEREISSLAISLSLGQDDRRGMFDCKSVHDHQHEDALGELQAWVNWLEGAGVKEIVLLGHSRGGNQIAWFAAESMRSSISRIVLMAPQTAESDGPAGYEKNYGLALDGVLAKARQAGKSYLDKVDFIYCPQAKVRGSSFVSYYKGEKRRDTPSLLDKIKRPVLLLMAENDTVVTNLPDRMQGLGKLANVKSTMISEAGHMFLDFALEDAADAIAEFLD